VIFPLNDFRAEVLLFDLSQNILHQQTFCNSRKEQLHFLVMFHSHQVSLLNLVLKWQITSHNLTKAFVDDNIALIWIMHLIS